MSISALGSVYERERPEYLHQCLQSLAQQTRPADEVVLVLDGFVGPELTAVIEHYQGILPLRSVPLPSNQGLGRALNAGLRVCTSSLIARFDTDDINVAERFQLQEHEFLNDSTLDICGGDVVEFEVGAFEHRNSLRKVPRHHRQIVAKSWLRNPFNHPTIMFRRSSSVRWNGYVELNLFEDFLTWQTWIKRGAKTLNIPAALVHMRVDEGSLRRRGGWHYVKAELNAAVFMLRTKTASSWQCMLFVLLRIPVRIAPMIVRRLFYKAIRSTAKH